MTSTTDPVEQRNAGRADRRAQLLRSATRLFFARGFYEVSVADIARDQGLSAGAIYRYVPDKMSLLVDSIQGMVDEWSAAAFAAVEEDNAPDQTLELLARSTTSCAVDKAEVVGLWHREAGVLPAEATQQLVEVRSRTIHAWSEVLHACEPDMDELEFRVRVALGVLNSVPELRPISRGKQVDLLTGCLIRALRAQVAPVPAADGVPEPGDDLHRSDIIAREAARLFRSRGYGAVGMNEIGAASGVAGPSIYKHYAGKLELLTALVLPIAEAIAEITRDTEASDDPPAERLQRFLAARTELAVARKDQMSVFVTESKHLDAKDRREVHQVQVAERAHFAALMREVHGVDATTARVTAAACLGMVDSVARSQRHGGDAHTQILVLAMASQVVSA